MSLIVVPCRHQRLQTGFDVGEPKTRFSQVKTQKFLLHAKASPGRQSASVDVNPSRSRTHIRRSPASLRREGFESSVRGHDSVCNSAGLALPLLIRSAKASVRRTHSRSFFAEGTRRRHGPTGSRIHPRLEPSRERDEDVSAVGRRLRYGRQARPESAPDNEVENLLLSIVGKSALRMLPKALLAAIRSTIVLSQFP